MDIEQGFNKGEKNYIIKIVNVTNSLKKSTIILHQKFLVVNP